MARRETCRPAHPRSWPSVVAGCGGDEPARITRQSRHRLHERPPARRLRVGRRRRAGRRAARARRAPRPRGRAADPPARAARDRRARPSLGPGPRGGERPAGGRRSHRHGLSRRARLRRHRRVAPDHQQGGPPPGVAERRPDQPAPAPARAAPRRTRALLPDGPAAASSASARATSTRRGCWWTGWARSERAGVAVVFDREIYGRELAGQVTTLARDAGITPVAAEEYRGRVDDIPDIVRRLGEAEPDAVVLLSVAGTRDHPDARRDRRPACPACRCSHRAGSWRCPSWRRRPSRSRSRRSGRRSSRSARATRP